MKVDTEDLAGFLELGEMVHVKRGTVGAWYKNQPAFPREVLRLSMGPIFSRVEFLEWYRTEYMYVNPHRVGFLDEELEQESNA